MDKIFGRNKQEHPVPLKAEVKGEVPSWLCGTLLRNGPGMHTIGETSYNHWFDGLALLHSFTIKNGEVHYRSKYLRSDTYNSNIEANRIVVSEFGTMAYPDPCKNIFAKAFSYLSHTIPEFTDNCMINIMKCGEDFYATTETNFIRKIDPQTLETLEKVDYSKYVAINLATSHPHYDVSGNVLNMGTSIVDKGKTKYVVFKIPSDVPACMALARTDVLQFSLDKEKKENHLKHIEVLCSIPSRSLLNPSYYHSFGVTENYIIFLEQPFKLDILKMATAYIRGVSWASCISFHEDEKTYIHIIDRRTKKSLSTKFYTDAVVVFHHVNAFEEEGHVVFDVISYKDNSLYNMFYLANLNQNFEENSKLTSTPTLIRFAVPLRFDKIRKSELISKSAFVSNSQMLNNFAKWGSACPGKTRPVEGKITGWKEDAEVGCDLVRLASTTATALKEKDDLVYCHPEELHQGIELPHVNLDYDGKRYRYIFAAEVRWSPVPTKIIKFDIHTKTSLKWEEEHCWPAEPVFVPRPNAKEEDDGIILSAIVSTDPKKFPFLLILDAKDFTELARASVDADMNLDLHGLFIPEKEMSSQGQ